jgi:hypothetical protein
MNHWQPKESTKHKGTKKMQKNPVEIRVMYLYEKKAL